MNKIEIHNRHPHKPFMTSDMIYFYSIGHTTTPVFSHFYPLILTRDLKLKLHFMARSLCYFKDSLVYTLHSCEANGVITIQGFNITGSRFWCSLSHALTRSLSFSSSLLLLFCSGNVWNDVWNIIHRLQKPSLLP